MVFKLDRELLNNEFPADSDIELSDGENGVFSSRKINSQFTQIL